MAPVESIPPISPILPSTPVVPRRKAPEGDKENHHRDENSNTPPEKRPDNNPTEKPDRSDSPTTGVDRYA